MELKDAASYFDNESFVNSYDLSSEVIHGQTDVYDGSKRDGSTVVRRIISVTPGTVMPSRGAVRATVGKLDYIVGLMTYDSFAGVTVREKYILQRSDSLATLRTAAQALEAVGGTDARAGILWLKNAKDERVGSESFPLYNLYFSAAEVVTKGLIVDVAGILYRVKVVNISGSGFRIAESYQFETVVETITYTPGSTTKDAASDSYLPQTPLAIAGLRERFLSFYDNEDAGRVKFAPGDEVLSVRQADVASPLLQDFVTFGAEDWNIMDARDPGDSTWALHIRRK